MSFKEILSEEFIIFVMNYLTAVQSLAKYISITSTSYVIDSKVSIIYSLTPLPSLSFRSNATTSVLVNRSGNLLAK